MEYNVTKTELLSGYTYHVPDLPSGECHVNAWWDADDNSSWQLVDPHGYSVDFTIYPGENTGGIGIDLAD